MATFGKTSIGGSSASTANIVWCKFTPSQTGTITSISYYVAAASGTVDCACAIYSDNSGAVQNKLAEDTGNVNVNTTPQWVTVPISYTITAGVTYWLARWTSGSATLYWDAGATNQYYVNGATFETWPNPEAGGGTLFAREVSIYATFTPTPPTAPIAWFTNSGISLEYLAFGSVVNLTESPTNTYTRTTTGNASAKATKSLAASTNGYIVYDVNTTTSVNGGIGFSSNGSQSPDYTFDYLNYLDGGTGTYKTYDTTDGYVDSGVTAVTGDLLKIERTGSTFVASYYRGGSWTTLKTYTTTSSAQQYIYLQIIDVTGTQRVINPQGYNIS